MIYSSMIKENFKKFKNVWELSVLIWFDTVSLLPSVWRLFQVVKVKILPIILVCFILQITQPLLRKFSEKKMFNFFILPKLFIYSCKSFILYIYSIVVWRLRITPILFQCSTCEQENYVPCSFSIILFEIQPNFVTKFLFPPVWICKIFSIIHFYKVLAW